MTETFRFREKILVVAFTGFVFSNLAPTQGQIVIGLNPKATYLHTNQDSPLPAVPIELSSLNIFPGDPLRLAQLGDFDLGPGGDTRRSMVGVFSSSTTLLATSNAHRVPDAIDAGRPVVTGCTFHGCQPTDIPEDFSIAFTSMPGPSVCVEVPAGATHLFVGPADSLFLDNTDPDGDYGLELTIVDDSAPDCNGTGFPDECEVIAAGDFDANGVVDPDDLVGFVECLAGPNVMPKPTLLGCAEACLAAFDFDGDLDIDMRDFAEFGIVFLP